MNNEHHGTVVYSYSQGSKQVVVGKDSAKVTCTLCGWKVEVTVDKKRGEITIPGHRCTKRIGEHYGS